MAESMITVDYHPDWRAEYWDDDVPSRPGWSVTCAICGPLGSPPGWRYASSGTAHATATRHIRSKKHERNAKAATGSTR
jgi:hypothetical protein